MIDYPKKRTQVERREAAERRLFEAAVSLASENGFDGFSLAELGLLAGFSRGLPAHYFGSKDNFQKQFIIFMVEEFKKNQSPPEPNKDLSSLVEIIENAFKLPEKNTLYSRIMLIILSDKSGKLKSFEELAQFRTQAAENLEIDLRKGMNDGYIRNDIDPKLISRFLLDSICNAVQLTLSDDSINMKKVSQELTKLILNGIEAS